MKRSKHLWNLVTYIFLIFMSIVAILPFIWMIRSSLMEAKQIFVMPPVWIPNPVRFDNYRRAMEIADFGRFFLNTIFIVFFVVTGTVLTSSAAAYAFSRIKWPGRDLVFGIIVSGMMLPYVVTLIPTFIGWNFVNAIDTYFPLIVPAWLGGGAYNIFLLRQFFRTIPGDLDQAAKIDGASHWCIFFRILLPLSKPSLVVVALFSFMGAWNDFMGPLVYLNSEEKFTLSLGLMMFKGVYTAQWELIMAASTIVIIPVLIVFLFGQRYFIEGIALTGMKN